MSSSGTTTATTTLSTSFKNITSLEPIYIGGNVPHIKNANGDTLLLLRKSINIFTLLSPINAEIISKFEMNNSLLGGGGLDSEENEDPFFGFCIKNQNTMFTINHKGLFERWLADDHEEIPFSWKAHSSPITVMEHHPIQSWLATGSADHGVRIWDSEKGYCTHNFKGGAHGAPITALSFLDQNTLISGAQDGSITTWSLSTSKVIQKWSNRHCGPITKFLSSPHHLITSSRDRIITIFSIVNMNITHLTSLSVGESIECMCWKVEGESFYIGGQFGKLREFSMTGEIKSSHQTLLSPIQFLFHNHHNPHTPVIITEDTMIRVGSLTMIGNHGEITDSTVSVDSSGKSHLHLTTNSPEVRSYPISDDGSIGPFCLLTVPEPNTIIDSILSCSTITHKNSLYMAIGSKNNKVIIYKDGLQEYLLQNHTDSVSVVLLFMRNGFINLATASSDLSIKLFIIRGDQHPHLKNESSAPQPPQQQWSIRAHDKDINSLLVNGNTIISGSQDKLIKIHSIDDGSLINTLKGHKRGIWSLAIPHNSLSHDHPFFHSILASSSSDNTIKLWNLSNVSPLSPSPLILTMEDRCVGGLLKISFIAGQTKNPSQLRLLSVSGDGLMKVWNPLKGGGICESTFDGHEDRCWAMITLPSGMVITSDSKGVSRVWIEDTEERQLNERQLKEEEILGLQRLSNLERESKWMESISLSLKLKQPFRLYRSLLSLIHLLSPKEAITMIENVVFSLQMEEITTLLHYCKEWNVSLKRSFIAQLIIRAMLKKWKGDKDNSSSLLYQVKEDLRHILPYTEKHFTKIDELCIQSHIIDYVIQ